MPVKKYYKCEDEYEDEQNGILGNIHIINVSFFNTYQRIYNHCKELLKGDFKLKDAFQGGCYVYVLLEFLQKTWAIPIMNPLLWFLIPAVKTTKGT